jgi:hypothetical protein
MHSQIELVSPAQAKEYLERAIPNRKLSTSTVTRYADDMRGDRWDNNGQPLIFNEAGQLLDGQHRLHAVVISGRTVAFLVVRGVASRAMETLDSGRGRSLQDVLALKGYKNSAHIGGAARIMWNYAAKVNITYTPSKPTLMKFIEQHTKFVLDAAAWIEKHPHILFPRAPVTAIIGLATESAQLTDEAHKFLEGIYYGEGLYKGDARYTLRRFMENLRSRHEYVGGSVSVPTFGAVARAWTAYSQGQPLEVIRFAPVPSQANTKVFGFTDKDWSDVPDLQDRAEEVRQANLAKGPRFQSAAQRDLAKAKAGERAQVVREGGDSEAAPP